MISSKNISIKKLVSFTIDGVPAFCDINKGFITLQSG